MSIHTVLGASELRALRTVRVPVDGAEMAVDVVLPPGQGPWPVLISNLSPYHKDGVIGAAYFRCHAYFAAHGYVSVVADLRGLGGSSGAAWPNMDAREALDGAALVEWAASQAWCDGNVGMWGVSYGGVTALSTASVNPPHLRAIVPIYGCVDCYEEFFYPGGCRNCLAATGTWGPRMIADLLVPPLDQDPDGRWLEVWRARLEASEPWILDWHEHPVHDGFWDARSVAPENIEVPTFVIGGWRDLFPTATDTFGRLAGPKRLLMGPWMHVEPDRSHIAPVDHLGEMLRWWDQWLKGRDTGVLAEPPVALYVQGRDDWRLEQAWPIQHAEARTLYLGDGELADVAPAAGELTYTADPAVGLAAGLWDGSGTSVGMPTDQREDEARSLTFTGPELDQALQIAGSPAATLHVQWNPAEELNLVVKLNDVAPDGRSSLITTGWRRLRATPQDGATESADGFREVAVPLWPTCYELAPGHRLRVALSCADFPRIWPTPTNPTIRLSLAAGHPCSVVVPTVSSDAVLAEMPPPSAAAALGHDFTPTWRIEHDRVDGRVTVVLGEEHSLDTFQEDAHMWRRHEARVSLPVARPDGTSAETTTQIVCTMPDSTRVVVDVRAWVGQWGFAARGEVTVNGVPFFSRDWSRTYGQAALEAADRAASSG
jgi:putative CocE/NonD family hydrolase